MNDTYVIDGTNVCWWYSQAHPDAISISPLVTLLIAIVENNDDFYCVFDAPITHNLNEQGRTAEGDGIEALLKEYPDRFFRVIGSTRADGVVLHDADHHDRRIITNDVYRDYRDKYAWLNDKHTERLIQGNLQPSGLLTLDKLSYGQLSLKADLQAATARLRELLEVRSSPELTELQRQVQKLTRDRAKLQTECAGLESKRVDLDGQLRIIRTEHHDLGNQLAEVRKELEQQTARHEAVLKEAETASAELAQIRTRLETLFGIADFDAKEAELKSKLQALQSEITQLETQRGEKLGEIEDIQRRAQNYLNTLERQRQELAEQQRELEDDQACIRKAQSEIAAFLEPYPKFGGYSNRIPFAGSTWKTAVKRLRIFFDRNRICTHCYEWNIIWKDKCCACLKGTMTDNPEAIWKIVKSCAPK